MPKAIKENATLDSIAAGLLSAAVLEDDLETSPAAGEEAEEEEFVVETKVETDEEDLEEGEGEDDPDEEDEEDEEEEGDGGQLAYVDVSDDDKIEVVVDGQVKLFTIGEAKKALSGEGAIDARLQEATELRKAAQAEQTMYLEQMQTATNNLNTLMGSVQNVMFAPVVERPAAALRTSNPQQYIAELEAWEQDQQRVANGKAQVQRLVQQQQKALNDDLIKYRTGQAELLGQAVPELRTPRGKELIERAADVAKNVYGFSEQEIAMAADHRMYRMMIDLAAFHAAKAPRKGEQSDVTDTTKQTKPRPSVLRSGNTAAKSAARARSKQQADARAIAAKTGKPSDIAKGLLVPVAR